MSDDRDTNSLNGHIRMHIKDALSESFFAPKHFIETLSDLLFESLILGSPPDRIKNDGFAGCLVHCEPGGGKTHLLNRIRSILSKYCRVSYLNCAEIAHDDVL